MEDENSVDKKFQKELNSGVAALVLLDIVSRAEQPMYGYQIANMIGESNRTFHSSSRDVLSGVALPRE